MLGHQVRVEKKVCLSLRHDLCPSRKSTAGRLRKIRVNQRCVSISYEVRVSRVDSSVIAATGNDIADVTCPG
jgi:hypothetical protein